MYWFSRELHKWWPLSCTSKLLQKEISKFLKKNFQRIQLQRRWSKWQRSVRDLQDNSTPTKEESHRHWLVLHRFVISINQNIWFVLSYAVKIISNYQKISFFLFCNSLNKYRMHHISVKEYNLLYLFKKNRMEILKIDIT